MNQLNNIVSKINLMPSLVRSKTLSLLFGRTVKYAGTTGVRVEELNEEKCVVSLKNKKTVQNHIGSVHAVASALIAESATGFVLALNIPDTAVPVIKTMKLEYIKRARGDMRAEAHLTSEQIEAVRTQEKGEVSVSVKITDAEGKEPILGEYIWAWTPKKR